MHHDPILLQRHQLAQPLIHQWVPQLARHERPHVGGVERRRRPLLFRRHVRWQHLHLEVVAKLAKQPQHVPQDWIAPPAGMAVLGTIFQQQQRHRGPRDKGTGGKSQHAVDRLGGALWGNHHEWVAWILNALGNQGCPTTVGCGARVGAAAGSLVHALALHKDKPQGARHGAKQGEVGHPSLGDAGWGKQHDEDEGVDPADMIVQQHRSYAGIVQVVCSAGLHVPKVAAQAEQHPTPKADDALHTARDGWWQWLIAVIGADEEVDVQDDPGADEEKEGHACNGPGEEQEYFEEFIGSKRVVNVQKGRVLYQGGELLQLVGGHVGVDLQGVQLGNMWGGGSGGGC